MGKLTLNIECLIATENETKQLITELNDYLKKQPNLRTIRMNHCFDDRSLEAKGEELLEKLGIQIINN